MMQNTDLANRFQFHPSDDTTGPLHASVRGWCYKLATILDDMVPEGREKSLAITKLEEVMMWANAGIARQGPNI